jgi:hypothetical protein
MEPRFELPRQVGEFGHGQAVSAAVAADHHTDGAMGAL